MQKNLYADTFEFSKSYQSLAYEISLYVFGLTLIVASSHIKFTLPFSLVPITGQTLAVLIIGATYGAKRSLIVLGSYLLMGLSGLGVFAGGATGLLTLTGPTGGYIVGFLASAVAMGLICEKYRADRKIIPSFLLYFLGHNIIFLFGVLWLSTFIGFKQAIITGLIPFIPGEIVKSTLATLITKSLWSQKN